VIVIPITIIIFVRSKRTNYKPKTEIMKTTAKVILPSITGKILKRNSTHIAIRTATEIQIWTMGFDDMDGLHVEPEFCYSIPRENSDDVFAIFERLDEDMRCLIHEAEIEFAEVRDHNGRR